MLLRRSLAASVAFLVCGAATGYGQSRDQHEGELGAIVENGALRIGIDCSETRPCRVRFGSTVHLIKNAARVRPSGVASGLVYIYVEPTGDLAAGSALNVVCDGCKYVRGVTQFPANSIPLFTWTMVKGAFPASGGTDYRAEFSSQNITSGPGIVVMENEGAATVSADPTVLSLRAGAPPKTSTSACSTGQFTFDADYYYICIATNKWKRITLSNF
jgi:hypothetical protein